MRAADAALLVGSAHHFVFLLWGQQDDASVLGPFTDLGEAIEEAHLVVATRGFFPDDGDDAWIFGQRADGSLGYPVRLDDQDLGLGPTGTHTSEHRGDTP